MNQPDDSDLLRDIRDALIEILKLARAAKPKRRRVKQGGLWKTVDDSVPDVSALRTRWHHQRGMGVPKGSTWELDAVLASLSASCNHDAELASKAIAAFFACKEAFTVQQGHSVKEFARTMDRWIREANGTAPVPTPRGRLAEMDAAKKQVVTSLNGKHGRMKMTDDGMLRLEDFDHVPTE